jgi:uncharacterized repeat protein (TIGR01451 family)
MSALKRFRRGRLSRVRSIAVVSVLILAGLMWIGAAQAVHNTGMFELEGNTAHDSATTPPYDWNSLFGSTGNQLITPDPINGPLLADTFVSDTALPDQSYFTSNKDIEPIASGQQHWGCDPINNPLAKDNLLNAYAALVQVPANAPENAGDQVLYLASERESNNGTSFAGFWLLKDKNVGCSGSNAFSGHHTDGDILIISDYTNGGGTQDVSVYRWTGDDATGAPVLDASFNGSLCTAAPSNDDSCAIANSDTITTPWSPTSHDSNTFVEAGIDLTTLLGANGGCFTNFLAETRSSNQLTATLKDFASGNFSTCVPPPIETTATPGGSSVPLGDANQQDVATISPVDSRPDPTGTISFFLCNPSQVTAGGCESGGTQVGSPVTIVAGSATSDKASGSLTTAAGKYCWRAEYTPDADSSNFYSAGSETNSDTECFTVIKASPSIVTNASVTGDGVVGTDTTCDSATLSGSFNGTGTITFTLTAPDNTTSQVGSPVTVSGDASYDSPSCPALTQVGTYTWHATYSGDDLNNGAVDNGANESVTSIKASPSISTTQAPASGSVGDTYKDKATLFGGVSPTGTITFDLFANDSCSGEPVHEETVSVDGNGTYETPTGVQLNSANTYYWVASYGGDANNQSATSGCADEPVVVHGATIQIAKTVDAAQVNVGDPIGFTMTVWNSGDGNAHGVTLSDQLPANPGLSWTIASQGAGWAGSCSISAAGKLTCGPVTVPGGTTQADSTFTVHITSPTTGATGGDCPQTGVVDNTGHVTTSNDGSDDSSASVCVQAVVDLAITKSGSPATQELGQGNITWTMVVTNNGPSAATGVTVSDPMPAGNTFVSASSTQGTCTGGAILTCDIGNMAVGASVTITLITTPSAAGTQTNTAVVSGDRPETNLANNTATASVEITAPLQQPSCVRITKITPGHLIVGHKTRVTIHLARKVGPSVKGVKVRIKGAGINVKTKGANSKGIIKRTLKVKKAGILVFTPLAAPSCVSRIGVRGVFTPPVTG